MVDAKTRQNLALELKARMIKDLAPEDQKEIEGKALPGDLIFVSRKNDDDTKVLHGVTSSYLDGYALAFIYEAEAYLESQGLKKSDPSDVLAAPFLLTGDAHIKKEVSARWTFEVGVGK